MSTRRTVQLVLLSALLCGAVTARADEALWALLKGGGQVVLVRHGLTTPGVGDPEGMKLADCASQRNLNDEGRAEARRLGQAWRARGIPVGRVLSSPWCRCIETAKLSLGAEPAISTALSNLFGRPQWREEQIAALKPLVAARPASGNTVMFTHGSTVLALSGVSPDTAEMVILTPRAGGFTVAGRMKVPASGARP